MRKNMHKQSWIKSALSNQDDDNLQLQEINNRRAEKHLANLQAMLKEMAAFQQHQKDDQNIQEST